MDAAEEGAWRLLLALRLLTRELVNPRPMRIRRNKRSCEVLLVPAVALVVLTSVFVLGSTALDSKDLMSHPRLRDENVAMTRYFVSASGG